MSLQRKEASPAPGLAPQGSLVLQRCSCGGSPGPIGECAECRKKGLGLQRKEASSLSSGPGLAPTIVHEVLRSPGRPLDPTVRLSMESRFGHDFGRVRVHADAQAAESAWAVGALAYTVGSHVAFSAGRYDPGSGEGKRLLAHELAHVVQQGAQSSIPEPGGLAVSPANDPLEARADTAAEAVLRGAAAEPGQGAGPSLRRLPKDRFMGSNLPYREATELLKCNRIMKDPEYCRQAVLGEKPVGLAPGSGCGRFVVDMVPAPMGLAGRIEFHPDPRRCPKCKSIRLVQIVRIFTKPGVPFIWTGSEAGRENVKTKEDRKKGIEGGYFIDHESADCAKGAGCGIYYRDHFTNAMLSQDGSNDGRTAVHASLFDAPAGNADDIFEFETCARCHDTGKFLGCVDWGFTVDPQGNVTQSPAYRYKGPSATFADALKTFNSYYRNK